MSKNNRFRNVLKKVKSNKEYSIVLKSRLNNYCPICAKRGGSFYIDCSPASMNSKGRHGNGRPIYSNKYRAYKSWKHNRKTKWKI